MAKKFIDEDYTPEQIKSMLAQHCEHSEETKYYRDLTPEDLIEKHQELSRNLFDIKGKEEELKEVSAGIKGELKVLKAEQSELLESIVVKKEKIEGILYHVANHGDGVMDTWTETGEFFGSRRLRPDERQARLFIDKDAANVANGI